MHTLTLCFKENSTNVCLQFEDFQTAKSAYDRIKSSELSEYVEISDAYGHMVVFQRLSVMTFLLSDVAAEFRSNGDKSIIQAREQQKTNLKAEADPILNMKLRTTPKLVS